MTEISDDARRNRVGWTKSNAEYTDRQASDRWAAEEISWGVFGVPEASLRTLGNVADLAVSEYGASIWCDPHRWIPEAHRLLRPGGRRRDRQRAPTAAA